MRFGSFQVRAIRQQEISVITGGSFWLPLFLRKYAASMDIVFMKSSQRNMRCFCGLFVTNEFHTGRSTFQRFLVEADKEALNSILFRVTVIIAFATNSRAGLNIYGKCVRGGGGKPTYVIGAFSSK